MMPEAARERTVSFRARAPHSLRIREYPRPKASLDERDSRLVSELVTDVKGTVTAEVTIAQAITRPLLLVTAGLDPAVHAEDQCAAACVAL
jgi:hypothetical protein